LARLGLVFGTIAAASALITGPAGASTPEVFGGSATGTALNLSIGGTNLTGGVSVANVKSAVIANAEGTGILTPGLTEDLKTSVTANNTNQTKPHACAAGPALPAPLSALTVKLACSSSSSAVSNNNPTADATGLVTFAGLGGVGALSDQLKSGLNQLSGNLDKIPTLGPILSKIVTSVNTGQIIDVPLGPSESSVTTDAGKVVSKATTQGATIDLFSGSLTNPTGAPAPIAVGPLLSVTLGSAAATATYDRHTGKAVGTFDPALLTITQNTGLPNVPKTISIVPGQTQTIPSLLTVKVGAGSTKTNPDGSVTSVADGVSLDLFPNTPIETVLQLAHAQASAGGALATLTAAPHPPTLPFTGEHPWIPYAGLGFLGGALGLGFLAYRGGFRFGFRRS
jgi:hypothetical protein